MHNKSTEADGSKRDAAAKMGAELLALLQPRPGERILDIGCGNGDLTAEIAAAGAIPTGIDFSEELVRRAKQRHPGLHVLAEDACRFRTDVRFDAVFSHAALHWIRDAEAVARTIWLALREGGRFVAEFAGSGNVAVLTGAMKEVLEEHGFAWPGRNPWYHPTVGEYAGLLERFGFRVTFAQHFDKPAPLRGDKGIPDWLGSFAEYFFMDVAAADRTSMYRTIEAKVKPYLYREGQWMLDTSRLRIVAVKESEGKVDCTS
ncbi:class I SAM-dependent methyltransferase [Paenibacillus chartarius]|uniref:Class I SAM-dependent methyltransferase n=1 Tax=Paenibacillus chartarius TaxID=747481 RepID=A0ABV6DG72_9BACL